MYAGHPLNVPITPFDVNVKDRIVFCIVIWYAQLILAGIANNTIVSKIPPNGRSLKQDFAIYTRSHFIIPEKVIKIV